MTRDLTQITSELGKEYFVRETAEKKQKKLRSEYFEAATKALSKTTLAQKTTLVEAETEDLAKTRAELYNSGWIAISCTKIKDKFKVLLQEDVSVQSFIFVNPNDGMTYQRSAVSGSTLLDEERLQKEDPSLWLKITEWENQELLTKYLEYLCPVDYNSTYDQVITKFAEQYPDLVKRILLPLENIDPYTLAKLRPYIYEGSRSVKLTKPRKTKSEDIMESDT